MNTVIINFENTSLVSRSSAAPKRIRVEQLVAASKRVLLDFSGVDSVAPSFADELFGVLVERHGIQWLLANVRLSGVSEDVLKDIAGSIAIRNHRAQPTALHAH